MASKSLRKKIAKRIAALEKIRQNNLGKDENAVKTAENELAAIADQYKLTLVDMMDIDEQVQKLMK